MRNDKKHKHFKQLSITGLICFLISLIFLIIWISAFNQGTDYVSRLNSLNDYLPGFLDHQTLYTFANLLFTFFAVVLNVLSIKYAPTTYLKMLCIIMVVFSSMLLLLNLFSLM